MGNEIQVASILQIDLIIFKSKLYMWFVSYIIYNNILKVVTTKGTTASDTALAAILKPLRT